ATDTPHNDHLPRNRSKAYEDILHLELLLVRKAQFSFIAIYPDSACFLCSPCDFIVLMQKKQCRIRQIVSNAQNHLGSVGSASRIIQVGSP
ncbi:MAG TPA: hypothetical protein PKJ53_05870, partial [Spirochaetales bacterium]|nr:hypothetical protein [Spirochaetales bacterium]